MIKTYTECDLCAVTLNAPATTVRIQNQLDKDCCATCYTQFIMPALDAIKTVEKARKDAKLKPV
jgi:hypothetical protein